MYLSPLPEYLMNHYAEHCEELKEIYNVMKKAKQVIR